MNRLPTNNRYSEFVMESLDFDISSEMHFHRTRYQDESSCDSRLRVPSLRGSILSPVWVPGVPLVNRKVRRGSSCWNLNWESILRARAGEFHGSVVTSWWTSGNDRRKMSPSSPTWIRSIRPRRGESGSQNENPSALMNADYLFVSFTPDCESRRDFHVTDYTLRNMISIYSTSVDVSTSDVN